MAKKQDNIIWGGRVTTPMITEERKLNVTTMDVFSRLMADRIIFLGSNIDDDVANTIIAQLLFLDNASKTKEPINLYINSYGGNVDDGLAIYDTMKLIQSPVITTCVGKCCSMASILLAGGEKGKRRIMEHSRVMIHQPSCDFGYDTAADQKIKLDELLKAKEILYNLLAKDTGKNVDKILKDADRDLWFSAEDAVEYGLVDEIIKI